MARAIRAINDGLNEGICASPRKPLKDMTTRDALIEDMARTDDAAACLLSYDADARGSAPRVPARTFERTAPVASESRRPQVPAAGNSTRYEPTTETAYQPAEYYDDAHAVADKVGAQCERYDEYDAHDYSGRDYEDSYQLRGRKLWAAVAILALAMIGTAGAYSYRTMFGGEAQQQTAKIASVTANGDKQIQERLADRSTGERVVSREEQSLTIKDRNAWALVSGASPPMAETPPRVSAPLTTESSNVRPPPAPTGAASEPKRVRTVTMGLKGGPADAAPAPTAAAPRAAVPATPTPGRTVRPAAPASSGSVTQSIPLQAAPARPQTTRSQTALAAPAPRSSEGNYVVQLSANKTQEDAQASFRAMQAKYSSVLSGRPPIIRRKEQPGKGIYYGAQVGPFASREEATQLCEELKAAGGSCFVQRN